MVLRLAVALCATLALAQAGPLKDGDATPVKVEAEVKRHHHSGPPTREHLAPPLLTDVYPLAGDTVRSISPHPTAQQGVRPWFITRCVAVR